MTPWEKRDSSELFELFRAFYRRFRRRRRRKDAEVGSDRERRNWAGSGGPHYHGVDGIQTGWDKDKREIKLQEGQKQEMNEAQGEGGQKWKKKRIMKMRGRRRDGVREKWNWSWKDWKSTPSKRFPAYRQCASFVPPVLKPLSSSLNVCNSLCNDPFCISQSAICCFYDGQGVFYATLTFIYQINDSCLWQKDFVYLFCHISSTCTSCLFKKSMRLARLTWWHGDKIQAATVALFAQDKFPLGGANKDEYSCYILSQQPRKTWGEPVLGIPENYDRLTHDK